MSLPDPIVLLDARAKYVHPAFQMTRASTKTVFDAAGRMVTVPANALGWDHDPATGRARGYLTEPSATNNFQRSNDLSHTYWSKFGSSISGSATTGPDGMGMAKIVEDAQGGQHGVLRTVTESDVSALVFSAILAAAERTAINMRIGQDGGGPLVHCNFDLTSGSAGTISETGNATGFGAGAIDLGGGFYRCWLAASLGSGSMNVRYEVRMLSNGSSNYTGDGTSGLYGGYMQAEAGSYPTSYIETGSSTATRARDSLVLSDLDDFPWWRSERGTLLVDVDLPAVVRSGNIWSLSGQIEVRFQAVADRVVMSGSALDGLGIIRNLNDPLGRYIIAVSWDGEEAAAAANGALMASLPATQAVSATALGLGSGSTWDNAVHAHIRRAVYYPYRIASAHLQSLTAIQE